MNVNLEWERCGEAIYENAKKNAKTMRKYRDSSRSIMAIEASKARKKEQLDKKRRNSLTCALESE